MCAHKITTFTGTDLVGKRTQSTLLAAALKPSQRLEFPDYCHWSGRLIRALLRGEEFCISTHDSSYKFKEEKREDVYQALQFINRCVNQEKIDELLKTRHLVMDRYEIDSLVYGLAQGLPEKFISTMVESICRQSDLIIFLRGQAPFTRPGEEKDKNERNTDLQANVVDLYDVLSSENPDRFIVIDACRSMKEVHDDVCQRVLEKLPGLCVEPLSADKIKDVLGLPRVKLEEAP